VTLSRSLAAATDLRFDLSPAARGFALSVRVPLPGLTGRWSSAELLDGASGDAAPLSLRSPVLLFFLSRGDVGDVGDRVFDDGSGGDARPLEAAAAAPFEELTLSMGILLPLEDGGLPGISGLSILGDPS
jgi:hypothetical protein